MKRLATLSLLIAGLLLPASIADADWRTDLLAETTILDVTDQAASVYSAVVKKPAQAVGMVVWIDVTAGSTLLLDLHLTVWSPGLELDGYGLFANCPSSEGITGTGRTTCIYGPNTNDRDYPATLVHFNGYLPTYFKFWMQHGNANNATYTVRYTWIFAGKL